MTGKNYNTQIGRQQSEATLREQALCMLALESGECDDMSDSEWIALCEKIAGGEHGVFEENML